MMNKRNGLSIFCCLFSLPSFSGSHSGVCIHVNKSRQNSAFLCFNIKYEVILTVRLPTRHVQIIQPSCECIAIS